LEGKEKKDIKGFSRTYLIRRPNLRITCDLKNHIFADIAFGLQERTEGYRLRVLIVDDSETTRRLLRAIVGSRQWVICGEADCGLAGVQKYEALEPDLVLIDLALPDMNGIEVGKRMSEIDGKVPLVLFTVLDVEGLQAAARRAGICQVISKAKGWSLIQGIETAVNQSSELKTSPRN
jgi:two-component system, chemotaxis family, chemotaxis protein CheY